MIRSTLSRYCPFLARAKCILRASPVFALFRSSTRLRVYHPLSLSFYLSLTLTLSTPRSPFPRSLFLKFLALRYFDGGRSSKIRYARFPPITRVNSARNLRAENRKIVGPGKRLWPLLVQARIPSQTIFHQISVNSPFRPGWQDCCRGNWRCYAIVLTAVGFERHPQYRANNVARAACDGNRRCDFASVRRPTNERWGGGEGRGRDVQRTCL